MGTNTASGMTSTKPGIDLWDLRELIKSATSTGYTQFDGTHFTGDGYVPVKLTTFDATIKRLKRADAEARNYVANKLIEAGYTATGTPQRERTDRITFYQQTYTRGDDVWVAHWASDTEGTTWYYESLKNGRVREMPYGVTSGHALSYVLQNEA